MYTSWPNETHLTPLVSPDNKLDFKVNEPEQRTPAKVAEVLQKLGWTEAGTMPGQSWEQLWSKQPPKDATDETKAQWASDLQHGYWHWYEAMAYEFGKFMSIGDDKGENFGGMQAGGATENTTPMGPQ